MSRYAATWSRFWLLAAAVLLIAAACADDGDDEGLTVFAAASLRAVTDELEAAWLEDYPDRPWTLATEASNVLAAQIREGAPADVFLSADILRPRELANEGETAAEPVVFAANELALVVPAEAAGVSTPADLSQSGLRLVGSSREAPIARYTATAIERLAGLMPEPAAFAAAVEANIVSREDNVRAALAKVELGEGDAAFVYRTDALGSALVREVPLPEAARVQADYGAVQVSGRAAAADLVTWLEGPEARDVLRAAGFVVPA